jgi:ParB family chromosome partitioning protein
MDRENRERQNLSAWEQGVMYKRALDFGIFPSLRSLANAIGAQSGNVSTAIQLASFPVEIIDAFPSPLDLQYRWVGALKSAIEARPAEVLDKARDLAKLKPSLPAKEVLARLTATSGIARGERGEPLTSNGKALGLWRRGRRGELVIEIDAGALPAGKEEELREFLQRILA